MKELIDSIWNASANDILIVLGGILIALLSMIIIVTILARKWEKKVLNKWRIR